MSFFFRYRCRWTPLSVLALLLIAQGRAEQPIRVRNFGVVNERLFRGAEPDATGLADLAKAHVRLDIDLRESGVGTETERHLSQQLGMQYINVPLHGWGAPSQGDMVRILSLLCQDDRSTIFVHCRRGKDRTGTVIACYRMQHDGWSPQAAQEEANRYGMSYAERAMRSLIRSFQPLDLPQPSVVGP